MVAAQAEEVKVAAMAVVATVVAVMEAARVQAATVRVAA